MTSQLQLAESWFRSERITDAITRIDEPHVHEFLRANIWHIQGRDRDLIIDSGLGVASLRENLPGLFANYPILVLTHGHLDHSGSAHEFPDRRAHPDEGLHSSPPASLRGDELCELLGAEWPDMPEVLIDAKPSASFRIDDFSIPAAPITHQLTDGDVIDIGDRRFRVLHLPGHTPGSCCLYERTTGILFSGDVLYDDVLLDELHGSDVEQYIASLTRLRHLDVNVVYPGHGEPFSADRMRELIDDYLDTRAA